MSPENYCKDLADAGLYRSQNISLQQLTPCNSQETIPPRINCLKMWPNTSQDGVTIVPT